MSLFIKKICSQRSNRDYGERERERDGVGVCFSLPNVLIEVGPFVDQKGLNRNWEGFFETI